MLATDELDIETFLQAERPRLVRLCARLSGSVDAAEDLAQETMLAAWRGGAPRPRLGGPPPGLRAPPRNVSLSGPRRHYRELSQQPPTLLGGSYFDDLAASADPAAAME